MHPDNQGAMGAQGWFWFQASWATIYAQEGGQHVLVDSTGVEIQIIAIIIY